ncbi:MAG: acylphosphatase [Proteobacteria bacterium]|jgi:acylphosphatase|nr:acylphosphatase [Pseudomonadota bacterium]
MKTMIRKHWIFYGDVQGVGFRSRACHAAEQLGVTGWVKNLWNGSVEMETEGEEAAIERLIANIQSSRAIEIVRMESKEIPTCGSTYFSIRRGN